MQIAPLVSTSVASTSSVPEQPASQPSSRPGSPRPSTMESGPPIRPKGQSLTSTSSLGPRIEADRLADLQSDSRPGPSYQGTVRVEGNQLTSKNPVTQKLLESLAIDPAEVPGLKFMALAGKEPTLSLRLGANGGNTLDSLKAALGEDLSAPMEHATIPLLLGVIARGEQAIGDDLRGRIIPLLREARPRMESSLPALKSLIEDRLAARPDLSLKMAATGLLQLATAKSIDLKLLGSSLAVSSGLGSLWELVAAPKAKLALLGSGFASVAWGLPASVIDAAPMVAIEAADTMTVKKRMANDRGDPFPFMQKLGEALTAGVVSAIGALPNNLLEYNAARLPRAVAALIGVGTTEVAILSAAAGVPAEIAEIRESVKEAVEHAVHSGVMKLPEGVAQDEAIHLATELALKMEPSTVIGKKSMGVALAVGLVPFLLGGMVTGALPEAALRILRSTAFAPIEMIGMNVIAAISQTGVPGIVSSDHQRFANVIGDLLQHSAANIGDLESGAGETSGLQPTIDEEAIVARLAPHNELLRHVGGAALTAMAGVLDSVGFVGQVAASSASSAMSSLTRPFRAVAQESQAREPLLTSSATHG